MVGKSFSVFVCKEISFSNSVNVPEDPAVFVTAIFETTVVVAAGTVYSVVLLVAAAVRASTLVVVNGLTLVPTDDYTISGTTLTFATAPANLAEITVRYLRLS